MVDDERRIAIIAGEQKSASKRQEVLMSIQLPGELAIARHSRIQKSNATPVNRRGASAADGLQCPIRVAVDRYDASAQLQATGDDSLRRGDCLRGSGRTANGKRFSGRYRTREAGYPGAQRRMPLAKVLE